jgi:Protein of unknown function (DUF3098).
MPKSSKQKSPSPLVFEKRNYLALLVSVLLIAVGFGAMWMEGKFLGFVSLNVSPVVIVAGYAGVLYAILWQPSDEPEAEEAA